MVSLDDYLRAFVALHTFSRLCDELHPSAQHLRNKMHLFLLWGHFLYAALFVLSGALAVALLHC